MAIEIKRLERMRAREEYGARVEFDGEVFYGSGFVYSNLDNTAEEISRSVMKGISHYIAGKVRTMLHDELGK